MMLHSHHTPIEVLRSAMGMARNRNGFGFVESKMKNKSILGTLQREVFLSNESSFVRGCRSVFYTGAAYKTIY